MTNHDDIMRQAREAIDASKKLVAAHKGPTIGKNQCVHGSLARSCEICALQTEVDRLTAENAKLRAVAVAAKNYCDHNGHPFGQGCMTDHRDAGPCDCGYMELRKALDAAEGK